MLGREVLELLIKGDASSAVAALDKTSAAAAKTAAKTGAAADASKASMLKFGAAAAGGALVVGAALFKMATSFEDLALRSHEFGIATGVGTEAASRFIQVAKELNIESGTLETALGKMNKTLGTSTKAFDAAGIAIAKNADGTTNVTDTFLNVVDKLNGMNDATEKAALAAKIFGRGWQGAAALIGESSAKIREDLAKVNSGQVITDSEFTKAKAFHDSMDQLHNALVKVAMELGQDVLPAFKGLADILTSIAPLLAAVGKTVGAVFSVPGKIKQLFHETLSDTFSGHIVGQFALIRDAAGNVVHPVRDMAKAIADGTATAEELKAAAKEAADAIWSTNVAATIAAQNTDTLGVVFGSTALATDTMRIAADKAKDALLALDDVVINGVDSQVAYDDMLRQNKQDLIAYEKARRIAEDGVSGTRYVTDAHGKKVKGKNGKYETVGTHRGATQAEIDDAAAREEHMAQSLLYTAKAEADKSAAYQAAIAPEAKARAENELMIASLQRQADALAPGSPLIRSLEAYIVMLGGIPTSVTTTLNLQGAGGIDTKILHQGLGPKLIDGGMATVAAPGLGQTTVPTFTPGQPGESRAIHLTVNAGFGADGHAIGKTIVEHITRYERGAGKGWRT